MSIYNATPEGTVSVTRAALELRIPRNVFSCWVSIGKIPSTQVNGRFYVRLRDAIDSQVVISLYIRRGWKLPDEPAPAAPAYVIYRASSIEPLYAKGAV